MDYREFEKAMKEGEALRESTYKELTDLLDSSDFDYKKMATGKQILIKDILKNIRRDTALFAKIDDKKIPLAYQLTGRQKEILFAGGLLNWIKNN